MLEPRLRLHLHPQPYIKVIFISNTFTLAVDVKKHGSTSFGVIAQKIHKANIGRQGRQDAVRESILGNLNTANPRDSI